MARDRTARTRVRHLLASTGAVADPSGYATNALRDAIGYEGSPVAFIQLIASMERDDEIVREIRGKRTYSIAASATTLAAHAAGATTSSGPVAHSLTIAEFPGLVLDYDALARAIVRQLWAAGRTTTGSDDTVESEALRAERDEYASRLEAARRELDALLSGAEQDISTAARQH